MKNVCKLLAVVLAALLLLCGCGKKEPEIDYESLVVAPVDVNITDCLTEEQVSAVMGTPMTLLGVFEDSTQAIYTSADSTSQVIINLKNQTQELFRANAEALGDAASAVTTIGEEAYWCREIGELLVYQNGYALGVAVAIANVVEIQPYVSQLAELVLDRLQPAE